MREGGRERPLRSLGSIWIRKIELWNFGLMILAIQEEHLLTQHSTEEESRRRGREYRVD
jgi:hypothetical protein